MTTIKTEASQPSRVHIEGARTAPNWRQITLFLLTAGILVLCWRIAAPFLAAIVGATTLAVVTYRPYCWLESRTKRPALASSLGILAVSLSVITPAFFLVQELATQALAVINMLRTDEPRSRFSELLNMHPTLAARLQVIARHIDLGQASQTAGGYIASRLGALLGNTLGALTQLVVMVFILFFLYRDHRLAIASLRAILPLHNDEKELLLERTSDTIYATAVGRVIIAAVQGFLAFLAFWVLNVKGAVFWALLTALAGIIPAVGAFFVWLPVAVYLALTGHWSKAGLLTAWGALVVSTIDNFLYPALVGSRLQQHTVLVLIAVVGAVALFGISGVIIGPVVLTVAKTLLDIWKTRTASG